MGKSLDVNTRANYTSRHLRTNKNICRNHTAMTLVAFFLRRRRGWWIIVLHLRGPWVNKSINMEYEKLLCR